MAPPVPDHSALLPLLVFHFPPLPLSASVPQEVPQIASFPRVSTPLSSLSPFPSLWRSGPRHGPWEDGLCAEPGDGPVCAHQVDDSLREEGRPGWAAFTGTIKTPRPFALMIPSWELLPTE